MLRSLLIISFLIPFAASSQKMKGFCFSSPKQEITQADIQEMADMNANWIGFVPYAFIEEEIFRYDTEIQWKGERIEGLRKGIQYAHELGMQVMIKPDVWIMDGSYTGRYGANYADWETLESDYFSYFSKLLDLASEEKVELVCLGSEWGRFIKTRPVFWQHLISEARKRFDGKLSYCSNWDDFESVPFWDQLDYIGIDWYAPLATTSNTKFNKLTKSWKKTCKRLKAYSEEIGKPIFFPEFGWKSTERALVKPWDYDEGSAISENAQNDGFKSYFETIWKKDWFAGGFIWEWYASHDVEAGLPRDKDYTPQGKLAEKTIREAYAN